jgi:hypothetical protein
MDRRFILFRLPHKAGLRRCAPKKDIVRDRHWADERQLLVNNGDPEGGGFQGRTEPHFATLDFDAALKISMYARENFDERAFARPVFARQNVNFTRAAFKFNIAQNSDRAESLGDARQADQRGLSCGIHRKPPFIPWPAI